MTKRAKALHGWWPRFSNYQLIDGRIAPAKGARLDRYDPWEEYEAGKSRGEPPPYVELLNLLKDIRPHQRHEYGSDEIERILKWTRRHGLLGVLHEHLFASGLDLDQSLFHGFILVGPRVQEIEQTVIRGVRTRTYGGWVLNYPKESLKVTPRGSYATCDDLGDNDFYISDQFLLDLPEAFCYEAVGASCSSSAIISPGGTTNVGELMGAAADDDEELGTDTTSDDFWAQYCEPIEHWFGDVFQFAEAIYGSEEFPLGAMISSIRLNFVTVNGKPELQHTFNSLLAAMAFMYAQDQITGYRLEKCAGCGCEIVTSAYQTRYCSRTCGDRDRKRRSRAAAKLAAVATRSRGRRHRAP